MKAKKNMKLFDALKQFRNIEPDAQFTQRSRTEILLSPQTERRTMSGVFTFLHVAETGAVVALVGFFILILTGSFAPTRPIAPIRYSVIDPQGLRAEAEAIDMQIRLVNVGYPQATSTIASALTAASPAALGNAFATVLGSQSTSSAAAGGVTSTASTTTLSIDQALQELSQ
jgi:hypothetical protein